MSKRLKALTGIFAIVALISGYIIGIKVSEGTKYNEKAIVQSGNRQ